MWRPLNDAGFTVLIILLYHQENTFSYSSKQMYPHNVGEFSCPPKTLGKVYVKPRDLFSPPMQPMWRALYAVGFTWLIILLRLSESASPGKDLCWYSPDQMHPHTVGEFSYPPRTLGKYMWTHVLIFPLIHLAKNILSNFWTVWFHILLLDMILNQIIYIIFKKNYHKFSYSINFTYENF